MENIISQHPKNSRLPADREKLLRWPDVQTRVGICRSHAESLIREGKFPKPIKLSERVSAWVESDVNIWIEQRISAGKGSANEI